MYIWLSQLLIKVIATYIYTLAPQVSATRHLDKLFMHKSHWLALAWLAHDCMVARKHNLECDTGKDSGQGEYLACMGTFIW